MNTKKKFQYLQTYSLVAVFLVTLVGVGALAYQIHTTPTVSSPRVAAAPVLADVGTTTEEVLYPNRVPMQIGDTLVEASVAESWPERIKGLSDTPYLPETVVKFFVFDSPGFHSIWMKDMQYSLDIIWLNSAGEIVHIVEGAAPESFPAMFVPEQEAVYVVEAVAGFVQKNDITKNSPVILPKL